MGKIRTHYDNLKVARGAPPEVILAAYRFSYPFVFNLIFNKDPKQVQRDKIAFGIYSHN